MQCSAGERAGKRQQEKTRIRRSSCDYSSWTSAVRDSIVRLSADEVYICIFRGYPHSDECLWCRCRQSDSTAGGPGLGGYSPHLDLVTVIEVPVTEGCVSTRSACNLSSVCDSYSMRGLLRPERSQGTWSDWMTLNASTSQSDLRTARQLLSELLLPSRWISVAINPQRGRRD